METKRSPEANTIICRCSDVTLERIRQLIDEGYTSFDEIKRITRIGMGPCQSKTCAQLVMREIAIRTGKPITEQFTQTTRAPMVGIPLELIAKQAREEEDCHAE